MRSWDIPALDKNTFEYCWRNSRQTVINTDYNMTKQLKSNLQQTKYGEVSTKSSAVPYLYTFCDVPYILKTAVVDSQNLLWRVREDKVRFKLHKTV